ncbi:4-phosphoerythronate dehydrogenase [Peptoniphilus harei ACS-146-V-Sch2b]|uniref:4-phosphoerythronate dehydrogenase n=1 Tax=Peptoniphilus harei ACS-146-V-Sch2b TaxID=908338 RepID=E4KWK6_9FIRM|nr:phosphoglycerate dehydrogenase [Peptoniphilus harei]EFR33600.1 4-phosphoerythronate dehydrogenase [Peptoniphilus harei ACS-146-V-Sch2b]
MKVLMGQGLARKYGERIEKLGYQVLSYDEKNPNEKSDYGEDILIGAIDLKKINYKEHKNLKYIFLTSVGIDFLDLDYIKKKEITLSNNNGAYDDPIAEWIVYGLLQINKDDRRNIENQKEKLWKKRSFAYNLYGKKALFMGTGTIAVAGAKRLKGFEIELNGFNTSGRKVEPFDNVYSLEELDRILPEMDYLIMCLPGTEKTHHMLNADRFAKLKDGVVVVNISRGSTIDEDALVDAVKSGKVRGAALDVFEEEPLSKDSELWELENVYIYPHISFTCEDLGARQFATAYQNLKALKNDGDFKNIVDFDKGY